MTESLSRRDLLQSGSWSALALLAGIRPSLARAETSPKIIDRQPFAFIQELSAGTWAVVSTPLISSDWTTGCNGGLIAGKERVLAIESFVRPDGAVWLAEQAEKLTGRRPTDVLITHFHGDHANGVEGYHADGSCRVWVTPTTLDLIRQDDAGKEDAPSDERLAMLEGARLIGEDQPQALDLGGRSVQIQSRRGHTPSDVTVEIDDPSIVFGGDLIWNGLFPNYRDTEGSAFSQAIRALRRERATTYVSGHGPLATGVELDTLLGLVDSIENAARAAHAKGVALEDAAAAYELPPGAADWVLFNPKYFEVAFKAWYQELG